MHHDIQALVHELMDRSCMNIPPSPIQNFKTTIAECGIHSRFMPVESVKDTSVPLKRFRSTFKPAMELNLMSLLWKCPKVKWPSKIKGQCHKVNKLATTRRVRKILCTNAIVVTCSSETFTPIQITWQPHTQLPRRAVQSVANGQCLRIA